MKPPVPSEHQEQAALFQWAALATGKYPELELLYAVPNGGERDERVGARLKAEGVKAGVPDVVLPVARQGCHALYIEMKRTSGGRTSPEQLRWFARLVAHGNLVVECKGAYEAIAVIEEYLR